MSAMLYQLKAERLAKDLKSQPMLGSNRALGWYLHMYGAMQAQVCLAMKVS